MYYNRLFSILTILAVPSWVAALQSCIPELGAVNGQCVTFYSSDGCLREDQITSFKPDVCSGECVTLPTGNGGFASFDSISVVGDGTFGVNCHAYSDTNCQTEMGETGNIIALPADCGEFPNAQSVKCFFKC